MAKLVILKFEGGNFQHGFKITLRIGNEGEPYTTEISGKLPPNPAMPEYYQCWQLRYSELDACLRARQQGKPRMIDPNQLFEQCQQSAQDFIKGFKDWLTLPDSGLQTLREKLCLKCGEKEAIRVIIQTDEPLLKKLPWHEWDLFANIQAEVALCPIEYETPSVVPTSDKAVVKILAILGNSKGIEVEDDRKSLENLRQKGAMPTFLVEPKRAEISEHLWDQNWNLLFFAGHSSSQNDKGRIFINRTESLTIAQLKFGLRKAINHGLQLAIFNSCDGLGLAEDLADLNIPQVIVMREPVPDKVAQKFLQFFLNTFVGGESLYLAVRHAREQLHENGLDDKYPGASWLPIIYQNPNVIPPSWESLRGGNLWHKFLAGFLNLLPSSVRTKLNCRFWGIGNNKFPVQANLQYGTKPNNPFSNYGHIIFGENFVGRENIIDTIKQRIINAPDPGCLAIIGAPRIGKSSLAYHTLIAPSELLLKEKILTFRINLPSAATNLEELFKKLVKTILEEYTDVLDDALHKLGNSLQTEEVWLELQHKVQQFFKKIKKKGWRIVAVIDEFDAARDIFKEKREAFDALRELAYQPEWRICLVTLSRRPLNKIVIQSSVFISTFPGIFMEQTLQCFTRDELTDLLHKLNQIDLEVNLELLEFVWKKTGGHPYLASALAFHIADMWLNNKEYDLEKAFQNSTFAFDMVASTKLD